ncbi:MAG: exodeoxyribonuclease VII large subunit [Acidimicrobiales bacterium]
MTLFDTQRGSEGPGDPRRVTLVRLSALIAQAIATVGRLTVEGEIHRPQSGRTGRQWFTLRDRASQVSVSVPAARRARCRIVAGERVAVTGRLEWVNDWGQLQLIAEEVVPVGEGAIAALIAETRERLRTDGLIDRPRRPIPVLPRAVGVVCGHEAAVRADIESVVAARFAGYPVVFVTTTVSGPGAVDNLVASIAELDGRTDVDVIILARGGGDSTALLPFSDEAVCRAVAAARTPVVAAIGHDGDRPLVDEVADLRCGTPSIAAAAVIPDAAALWADIDGLLAAVAASAVGLVTAADERVGRIDRDAAARANLDRAATRLARAGATRDLVHPARELDRATERLARIAWRTPPSAQVAHAERTLAAVMAQVETLSPVRVLERGYAVVRRADGSVVRDAAGVRTGEHIAVSVATGSFAAAVVGNGTPPRRNTPEGAAR